MTAKNTQNEQNQSIIRYLKEYLKEAHEQIKRSNTISILANKGALTHQKYEEVHAWKGAWNLDWNQRDAPKDAGACQVAHFEGTPYCYVKGVAELEKVKDNLLTLI